jgi:hypothetical protein
MTDKGVHSYSFRALSMPATVLASITKCISLTNPKMAGRDLHFGSTKSNKVYFVWGDVLTIMLMLTLSLFNQPKKHIYVCAYNTNTIVFISFTNHQMALSSDSVTHAHAHANFITPTRNHSHIWQHSQTMSL